jgi:hypothetical protein
LAALTTNNFDFPVFKAASFDSFPVVKAASFDAAVNAFGVQFMAFSHLPPYNEMSGFSQFAQTTILPALFGPGQC